MITKQDILRECKNALAEGQFLVDIKEKSSSAFIVYVDDMNGLSIGDCQRINKQIYNALDNESEDFSLEVSSPGLTKPFKVIDQYIKNINKQIEIVCLDGIKHKGLLKSIESKEISLEVKHKKGNKFENRTEIISFDTIKSAKVVIEI